MRKQNFLFDKMTVGVCYYPEHWDRALWESDIKRMLENGITVVRIAEFAWNKFENEEGVFNFDFFDDFLDVCEKLGMKVIFGTPTATPPAWLTEKYPEVLNARQDGALYRHGGRRHYNYNSPLYRLFCARIVEKIADHYAKRPSIIGWQIDNELNCEISGFYSQSDTVAFREFLKKKYETLDRLNEAWGTVFWNQTYTKWDQIFVPRAPNINAVNPHLNLDYIRFVSQSAISFCALQSDILRKYIKPGDFITTNGLFGNLDNHEMTDKCLDIYTYDSYPNFAYGVDSVWDDNALSDRRWSRNLTEVRSICPHFGVMEQQSGANGWSTRMEAAAPRPGQLNLWALQSVAHGADFVSFFRWRTAAFGTEMYWHGILDYDNRDNRRLSEVRLFADNLKKLEKIRGSRFCAKVAYVKDYDNEWDSTFDVWHSRISRASDAGIVEGLQFGHVPYDVVYLKDETLVSELAEYDVLIYPHPLIINEARISVLKEYVENGGKLVIGCRAGQKDMTGKCPMLPMPGLFSCLSGSDVIDFTFQSPAEKVPKVSFGNRELEAKVFCDIMEAKEGAKVLASYSGCFFEGRAALIEKEVGCGKVLHYGSTFTRDSVQAIMEYLGVLETFDEIVTLPGDIELVLRENEGRKYVFLLNYKHRKVEAKVNVRTRSLLTGKEVSGDITLEKFAVEVLEVL